MFLADISVWAWVNIILILLVAYLLGMQLYTYISGKRVSTMLDNEEFKKGIKNGNIQEGNDKYTWELRWMPGNTLRSGGRMRII